MNTTQIEKRISRIVQQEGRRPRILLAHLENDQPDRWTKPLAASLAEFGFDVDIGPLNQAPLQTARLAIDNDVHMVCTSISDITNQSLVVQLAEALQAEGLCELTVLGVDRDGQLDLDELQAALRPGETKLVSVMGANNETGVLFPIPEIAEIVHATGALLHVDAVQPHAVHRDHAADRPLREDRRILCRGRVHAGLPRRPSRLEPAVRAGGAVGAGERG